MTRTFTIKLGKSPDEMGFDECMAHIRRVLFWDYIDGEWCDVVPLNDRRWEELAGYIRGSHERDVDALKAENAKLREQGVRLFDKTLELGTENALLRDLCEDMYRECAESMGYDHPLIRDLGIEASV